MSKNVMWVDNDPLYYVIRPDQISGWVSHNYFDQWMYLPTHTGAVYNRYKKMLWGNILKASLNTPSWECIKKFDSTEDSSSACQFMEDK